MASNFPAEQPHHTGWVLYYTAEGHPYYYNHTTKESQWAHEETNPSGHMNRDNYQPGNEYIAGRSNRDDYKNSAYGNNDDNDNDDDDNNDDDDDDDDEDDEDDSEDEEDDDDDENENDQDEGETKFKEYLKTQEGQRILEAELEKLSKKFKFDKDSHISKNEKEKQKAKKKSDGSSSSGFSLNNFFSVVGNTMISLYPGQSSSKLEKNKKTRRGGSDSLKKGSAASKDIEAGPVRLTRESESVMIDTPLTQRRVAFQEESFPIPIMDIEAVSSSSSENDNDSVSSDDSDLAVINAPMIPEWFSLKGLVDKVSNLYPSAGGVDATVATAAAGDEELHGVMPPNSPPPTAINHLIAQSEELRNLSMQVLGKMTNYVVTSIGMGLVTIGGAVLGKLESALKSIAEAANERKESLPP